MKPLDYIATNPSVEDMASKALLFSAALNSAMQAKQGNNNTNHRITPVELTDGRYGIRALTFTECNAGGIFRELFGSLDTAIFNTAEIVEMSEMVALLPVDEEI